MSIAAAACAVLAAAAVAIWLPAPAGRLLADRVAAPARAGGPPGVRHRGRPPGVDGTSGWTRSDLVQRSPAALAARRLAGQAGHAWRSRRATARRRAQVVELCTAIGADLRAGAVPVAALGSAAQNVPGLCDEVGRVAAMGGDAVQALRRSSTRPGAEGLSRLAAAWAVTELTGSGLADGCERVAAWLRQEESLRREVAAQLAGARASARLLTVLPLFGLALGAGIGGDPVSFLLGTPYGLACLVAGTVLVLCGLAWTEWLARSAEGQL